MKTHDADSSGTLDFMEFVAMICASGDAFKLKITNETKAEVIALSQQTYDEMLSNPESAVARRAKWKTEEKATDLYNDLCSMFVLEEDGELFKTERTHVSNFVAMVLQWYESEGMAPLCKSQAEVETVVYQEVAYIGEELNLEQAIRLFLETPALDITVSQSVSARVIEMMEDELNGRRKDAAILSLQAATRGFSAREAQKQVYDDAQEQLERLVELFQSYDKDETGSLDTKVSIKSFFFFRGRLGHLKLTLIN